MRARSVREEFEAEMEPTEAGRTLGVRIGRAKSEWKHYGDGTRRWKVILSGLNLADGTELRVLLNGDPITGMAVRDGRARYEESDEGGGRVRAVAANDVLQVACDGRVILEGSFRPE